MKIIDPNGRTFHPGMIAEVPIGNLLWVDPVNGIDGMAVRGGITTPFKTLAAAKSAAKPAVFVGGALTEAGDTIVVLPGVYTAGENLAKSGVNWHFMAGAKVVGDFAGDALFTVDEETRITVSGDGEFDSGDCTYGLQVTGVDAQVSFTARSLKGLNSAVQVDAAGADVQVRADTILSDVTGCLDTRAGKLGVEAREIAAPTSVYCSLYFQGGETHVRAQRILAPGAPAIYCLLDAQVEIEAFEIRSLGDTVYFDAPDGVLTIRNARLVSDSGYPVFIYNSSSGTPPNCRLWNCHLKSMDSFTPSVVAPEDYPATVGLYGQCTATTEVDTDVITKIGTALTVVDLG